MSWFFKINRCRKYLIFLICNYRAIVRLFGAAFLMPLTVPVANAQEQTLTLTRPTKLVPFKDYRITEVKVSPGKAVKSGFASLIGLHDQIPANKPILAGFRNGLLNSVKNYVAYYDPLEETPLNLIMFIDSLDVKETSSSQDVVRGAVRVYVSFSRLIHKDTLKLCSYRGAVNYSRSWSQSQVPSQQLQNTFDRAMQFLESWMQRNEESSLKLARSVICRVNQFRPGHDWPDTIYYSIRPRLKWDDFTSKVPSASYVAELFPTLAYTLHTEVHKGRIELSILLKASLAKDAMWVQRGGADAYALNHEQRHFDLLQIAAYDFRKVLLKYKFPLINYEGDLSVLYLDAWRHMTNIEDAYDRETKHGILSGEQERWNQKTDDALKTEIW